MYKFVVEEDTLYRMHKSFSKHIYEEGLYYVISQNIPLDVDLHKYLYKCVDIFCNSRTANPYLELDVVDQVLKEKRVDQRKIKWLIRICHYKKVLYSEFEILLRKAGVDEKLVDKYIAIRDELMKVWSKINGKIMYYLYKKMPEKVEQDIQRALATEETMLSCMNEILDYLKNETVTTISSKKRVDLINNSDNIISEVSDNEFVFEFDNGKIYNNWFEDCAPKVLFNDVKDYNEFCIRSKFVLEEYTEGSNFVFGIFLKDNSGSSYIMGLNSGVTMLFEHTGVDNAVWEKDNCSSVVDIEIKIKHQELFISYMLDEKKDRYETHLQIKGDVVGVGICCKTWGEANKLRFRAKDIKIEV